MKKIIIVLLCACMTIALMPAFAFAEGTTGTSEKINIALTLEDYSDEYIYPVTSLHDALIASFVWEEGLPKTPVEGTDYDITYYTSSSAPLANAPTAAGNYEVIITAKGDTYTGGRLLYVTIIDVHDLSFADTNFDYTYGAGAPVVLKSGSSSEPDVSIHGTKLKLGTDYEIRYRNRADSNGTVLTEAPSTVGKYEAWFVGINDYKGTSDIKRFEIIDLYSLKNVENVYNGRLFIDNEYFDFGSPVQLTFNSDPFILKSQDKELVLGSDYTITYKDADGKALASAPTAPGNYTAVFTGINSYHDSLESGFTIYSQYDFSFIYIVYRDSEVNYNGQPRSPKIVATLHGRTLVQGVDYKLIYFDMYKNPISEPTELGYYYARLIDQKDPTNTTYKECYYEIVEANDIVTAQLLIPDELYYTGSLLNIDPPVIFNGKTLRRGVDYELHFYSIGNSGLGPEIAEPFALGYYGMRAVGIGAYIGRVGEDFKIVEPKPVVNFSSLNFDVAGGSGIDTFYGVAGSTVDLSKYVPTREGYEFTGWYSDPELTNKITSVTLSSNAKIYAGWKKLGTLTPIKNAKLDITSIQAFKRFNKLTWTKVDGADGYQIFRSRFADKGFGTKPFFTAIRPYYLNTLRDPSATYYYKIRAFKTTKTGKVFSPFSEVMVCRPFN